MIQNRRVEPSADYCAEAGLPFPAPEHLWHPDEFTYTALKNTLRDMHAHDISFAPLDVLGDIVDNATSYSERTASLICTVRFSSGRAIAIANALGELALEGINIPAHFVFFNNSVENIENPQAVSRAMETLHDHGYDVGMTHGRSLSADYLGYLNAETADSHARRKQASLSVISTQHGHYTGGHPVVDFAAKPKKKFAVIEIADAAFAQVPMMPAQRLLNSVRDGEGLTPYLDGLNHKVLGADGTLMGITETRRSLGANGFVAKRHELS